METSAFMASARQVRRGGAPSQEQMEHVACRDARARRPRQRDFPRNWRRCWPGCQVPPPGRTIDPTRMEKLRSLGRVRAVRAKLRWVTGRVRLERRVGWHDDGVLVADAGGERVRVVIAK